MKEEFLNLLKSTNREGMDKLIDFIEKTDFFKAPASTRFHGDYEGGLLEHSLKVYDILENKVKMFIAEVCRLEKGHKWLKQRARILKIGSPAAIRE